VSLDAANIATAAAYHWTRCLYRLLINPSARIVSRLDIPEEAGLSVTFPIKSLIMSKFESIDVSTDYKRDVCTTCNDVLWSPEASGALFRSGLLFRRKLEDLSLGAVASCEVCQILRHVVVEGEFVGNVENENFCLSSKL